MPAKAQKSGLKRKKILREIGQQIRRTRKELKVSAIATTEAAGISRMTLNRIEKGESSVTMGAYLNVISVLGLILKVTHKNASIQTKLMPPKKIRLADYPQLKQIAWQLKDTKDLSPTEALTLYERNWRHLDLKKMEPNEWNLIQSLLGRRKPLV